MFLKNKNIIFKIRRSKLTDYAALNCEYSLTNQEALAIRRIFSRVDIITKPKFSNCPNVFKIGLFR